MYNDELDRVLQELPWLQTPYPTRLAVFVALSRSANRDNQCWPSYAAIQRATTLSRATVQRSLSDLKKLGVIDWDQGGSGRSNTYRFPFRTRLTGEHPPVSPMSTQQDE